MNKTILCFAFAASCAILHATDRTDAEKVTIATSRLSAAVNAKGRATTSVHPIKLIRKESTYSIYSSDGDGFVIVSRDDRFAPVIGYSKTAFNAEDMPCCFKWWLDRVAKGMETAAGNNRASATVSTNSYTAVAPMMTTKWHQSTPFNMYAPTVKVDGKDLQAPAGCVAIAMAQILNYNKYPASAEYWGEYYSPSSATAVPVKVNSTYSWNYQDAYGAYYPDGYASEEDIQQCFYSPAQARAIGALARDCGYSVGMMYNLNGSGAYSEEAASAFISCFSYPEETVKFYSRAFFSDNEWQGKISDELRRGYPIMYSGSDAEYGGHAFVVHGMDSNGLVYVNWGWQGLYDGYYAIYLMNAGNDYKFSEQQSIITNIHPKTLASDAVESMMVTNSPYRLSYNNTSHELTVTFTDMVYNSSPLTMKGRFGLVLEDLTDNTINYVDFLDEEDMEEGIPALYGFPAQAIAIGAEFDNNHTYRLYLASKDMREAEWQPVRTVGGQISYELSVGTSGVVTLGDNPVYTGIHNVSHNDSYNYSNEDTVYYTADGKRVDCSTKGLVIVKQGNTTKKIICR